MITYTCPSCHQKTQMVYIGVQFDENEEPFCTLWNCLECRSTVPGREFYPAEAAVLERAEDPMVRCRSDWMASSHSIVSMKPTNDPLDLVDFEIKVNGVAVMAFNVRPRRYEAGKWVTTTEYEDGSAAREVEPVYRTRAKNWACQGWTFGPGGERYYIKVTGLAQMLRYIRSLGLDAWVVAELARQRGWPKEIIEEGMEEES